MKTHTFKRAVQLLGILMLLHLIAMLFFGLFFSNSISHLSEDDPARANSTIFVFNIVFISVFVAVLAKLETSFADFRRELKDELKSPGFSLIKYWKKHHFRDTIMILILFAVFQIPFVIFYSIWGMALQYPTLFEQLYIVDAGSYLLTNSAVFGILINMVIFGALYFSVKFIFLVITKKDVENNMV